MRAKKRRLSKQAEMVGRRRSIAVRPEKALYKKLTKISIKKGVSMNQVVTEILNEGVNTLAKI